MPMNVFKYFCSEWRQATTDKKTGRNLKSHTSRGNTKTKRE